MAKITIDVDRSKLPDHTDGQFLAWVKFEVGYTGDIKLDNPLSDIDLTATFVEIK